MEGSCSSGSDSGVGDLGGKLRVVLDIDLEATGRGAFGLCNRLPDEEAGIAASIIRSRFRRFGSLRILLSSRLNMMFVPHVGSFSG